MLRLIVKLQPEFRENSYQCGEHNLDKYQTIALENTTTLSVSTLTLTVINTYPDVYREAYL